MGYSRHFGAPWGIKLRITTLVVSLVMVTISLLGLVMPKMPTPVRFLLGIEGTVILTIGSLFVIRGFEVTSETILVHRLLWKTTIPLNGLSSLEINPLATQRSIQMFGNGGFFAFAGWFRNKTLGNYRLFGTDLEKSVVMRYANGKTVVVTPEEVEAFVRCVKEQAAIK